MNTADCYIGLMSGTSVDAVDAVVARFPGPTAPPVILATHSEPPERKLRQTLLSLPTARHPPSLSAFGQLDQKVGAWFAKAAGNAMSKAGLTSRQIAAIGSHGQTLWHALDAAYPFSLQIGSPSLIAARTGCPVVADFRNADMALGGQGAPLVCAFHAAMLATANDNRVAVNIGGIANITLLPAGSDTDIARIGGFDTGPGNGLMDAWIQECRGERYDPDGAWAASGRIHGPLLMRLLGDEFLLRPPPKSTGREHFSLAWLKQHLAALDSLPCAADVQATLCELTAITIIEAIERFGPGRETLYLCGGGAHNQHLIKRIRAHAQTRPVQDTGALQFDPDWMEALAFAWLARQRLLGRPGNAPNVTGASGPAILGGWHAPPSH